MIFYKQLVPISFLLLSLQLHHPLKAWSEVLTDQKLRARFAPFLDTVLRQMPSSRFFAMVDTIQEEWHPRSEQEWYLYILNQAPWYKGFFARYMPLYKLDALRYQRAELARQLRTLIDQEYAISVKTCVEIGKPGTYIASLRDYLTQLEQVLVVHDAPRATDYIEGISLRSPCSPYHQFIALNEYAPITGIAPASVDLVLCAIGLHHIPVEKLNAFIASVRTILKPGGLFIVREHDIDSEETYAIVTAAHSVFNALFAQEPLEQEAAEFRNFQPLQYWVQLLEKHDFEAGTERMQQVGDPTMNTFIKVTARARTVEEQGVAFANACARQPNHMRDSMQTYLTTPEWLSVDIAQEYGKFINHTPFYEFPWMASVASYWKAFGAACRVAMQKRGVLPVLTSPYMLMNLFIGTTLTVEHIAKAVISAPIRWAYRGAEAEMLQAVIYDPRNEVAALGPTVTVCKEYAGSFKLIELPRYKEFLGIIKALPRTQELSFYTIGGQQSILCKILVRTPFCPAVAEQLPGATVSFTWSLPTQPDALYIGLTVPIGQLKRCVQWVDEYCHELLYVHDF